MSKGWIAVDFDRTLSYYDKWRGAHHVGEPIGPMVQRVRTWLSQGKDVRIFTARVSSDGTERRDAEAYAAREAINEFCEKEFGRRLLITDSKDWATIAIYDDRAVQVVPNDGSTLEEYIEDLKAALSATEKYVDLLQNEEWAAQCAVNKDLLERSIA